MLKLPLNLFCVIFMTMAVANAKPGLTPPEDMKDDIPRSMPFTGNDESETSTEKIMDSAEIQKICSKFDQDCATCLKTPKCHFSLYKDDVTKCSNEPVVTDIVEEIFVEEKCPAVKAVKSSTESSNVTVTSTPISSSTSTFTTTAASNQTSSTTTTTTTTSTSAETAKTTTKR